jgi:hypothetical protein
MEKAKRKVPHGQSSCLKIWFGSTFHYTIVLVLFSIVTCLSPLKSISTQLEQPIAHDQVDLHGAFGTFSLCNSHFSLCPLAFSPSATCNTRL